MSTITIARTDHFIPPLKTTDNLRRPLFGCGQLWSHLYDLGEGSTEHKALQIALRIIPTILLAVVTAFAGALASLALAADAVTFCTQRFFGDNTSWSWARHNNDSLTLTIPMDQRLQDRCRLLRIDGDLCLMPGSLSNFKDVFEGAAIRGSVFRPGEAVSIELSNHVLPSVFNEPFQSTLALGFNNRDSSYDLAKHPFWISPSRDRAHEVFEVVDAILGISGGGDISEHVKTFLHGVGKATLLVSRNLDKMELHFVAR